LQRRLHAPQTFPHLARPSSHRPLPLRTFSSEDVS
jgi:hypothetical protein